jgi:hypothetical protein
MLQRLCHRRHVCVSDMRILRTFSKGSQRDLLLAVDFEQGIQPGDLKQVRHSLVEPGKFHLASPLSDHAIASDQFTHAVAVHVIHSRKIQQELLVAVVGEDVDQIAQLRATITERESANRVHYNDSVELSCTDLKAHSEAARPRFSCAKSYLAWPRLSTRLHGPSTMSVKGIFQQLTDTRPKGTHYVVSAGIYDDKATIADVSKLSRMK